MKGFLHTIVHSFYDISFYQQVRFHWKGWAIGTILGVYAILVTLGTIVGYFAMQSILFSNAPDGGPGLMERSLHEIATQWPDMRITKEGVAELKQEGPATIYFEYTVKGSKERQALMTIDTSGATTYDNMKTPILMTNKDVIFKDDKETKLHSIKEFTKDMKQDYIDLNAEKMTQYVADATKFMQEKGWIVYLIFGIFMILFLVPFLLFMRVCLLIPLGLAGWIVSQAIKDPMDYSTAVRLISVVLIPVTIIDVLCFVILQSGVSVWVEAVLGIVIIVLVSRTKPAGVA